MMASPIPIYMLHMDIFSNIQTKELSQVLSFPQSRAPLSIINNYKSLKLLSDNSDNNSYLQINTEDQKEWTCFIHDFLLENFNTRDKENDKNNKELVVIIDCAYQLGHKELQNSLLNMVYKEIWSMSSISSAEAFFKRILILRDFDTLADVNNFLQNLFKQISSEYQSYELNTILISNPSVFYWGLRNQSDQTTLSQFHKNCRTVAQKLHCTIISSRNLFN